VLRFNFRGVGRNAGAFDQGVGEQDDFRAALDFVRTRYPEAPLELVVIDGADHVFDGKAGEVADAIEDLLGE
jgi:alpha/beta superfamily hydrolase